MCDNIESLDLLYNEMTEDSELIEMIARIENGDTLKGVRIA